MLITAVLFARSQIPRLRVLIYPRQKIANCLVNIDVPPNSGGYCNSRKMGNLIRVSTLPFISKEHGECAAILNHLLRDEFPDSIVISVISNRGQHPGWLRRTAAVVDEEALVDLILASKITSSRGHDLNHG